LTFEVEENSFDATKFIRFLEGLRGAVGEEKLYVLLDNCRVHHAKLTQPQWARLNFEPVWNVAYSPEYNQAIERYWGQLKATFRPLLLQKMLAGPRSKDTPLRDALYEAIRTVPATSIPAYVARGLETLRQDAEAILQTNSQKE